MTTTLIHRSPLGAIQIAGVLGAIEPGEPFDVTDDQAATLLEQSDTYELVDGEPTGYSSLKVAELRDILANRDLPTKGKHSELVARLEAADTTLTTTQGEPA